MAKRLVKRSTSIQLELPLDPIKEQQAAISSSVISIRCYRSQKELKIHQEKRKEALEDLISCSRKLCW